MGKWFAWILLVSIAAIVAVLAFTSLPFFGGHHLQGPGLKLHMLASGALVCVLPLFAVWLLSRNMSRMTSSGVQRLGYWSVVISGLITILTMFLCMLPYPSTERMHQLIQWHGYAGFAMVPAVLLVLVGMSRPRSIQATRSETPG